MAKPLNAETLAYFSAQLDKLTLSAPRQFGTLDPHRMLTHLYESIEISLGRKEYPDASNAILRNRLIRYLFIYILPVPKGKIKVPAAMLPTPSRPFDEDRESVKRVLKEFVEMAAREPGKTTRSVGFGLLNMDQWAHLHGKHLIHHYSQFGIA